MSSDIVSRSQRAIETARAALRFIVAGPPLVHRTPEGLLRIDVPLLYNGFAVDRVHFNPKAMSPLPKGLPIHIYGEAPEPGAITKAMESVVAELRVIDAAEYREPEESWAVPLAWRALIVAHVKIRDFTWEVVPDYPLTEELRRRVT